MDATVVFLCKGKDMENLCITVSADRFVVVMFGLFISAKGQADCLDESLFEVDICGY